MVVVCPDCSSAFKKRKQYLLHAQLMRHGDYKYSFSTGTSAGTPAATPVLHSVVQQPAVPVVPPPVAQPAAQIPCIICNLSFTSETLLRAHYKTSAAHPTCTICGLGCKDHEEFSKHARVLHNAVICLCGMLVFRVQLATHYQISPGHPKCPICKAAFGSASQLNEHAASAHPNTFCTPCQQALWTPGALRAHYTESSKHPQCEACRQGYESDNAYRQHEATVHCPAVLLPPSSAQANTSPSQPGAGRESVPVVPVTASTPPSLPEPQIICQTCSLAIMPGKGSLEDHYRVSLFHPKCAACGAGFEGDEQLQEHTASVHADASCASCRRLFADEGLLREHFKTSLQHPHCMMCNEGCRDEAAFDEHMKIAHPTRPVSRTDPAERNTQPLATDLGSALSSLESAHGPDCTYIICGNSLPSSPSMTASATDAPEQEDYASIERPESALTYVTDMDGLSVSTRAVSGAGARSVSVNASSDSCITAASTAGDSSEMPTAQIRIHDISRRHVPPASNVASLPATPAYGTPSVEKERETRGYEVQGIPRRDAPNASTEVSTESSLTATVQTQSASQAQPTAASPSAPKAVSWRCRSCGSDPCKEPTATQCGHIFCYGCIVHEIMENMQCPACSRLFLLRLEVD